MKGTLFLLCVESHGMNAGFLDKLRDLRLEGSALPGTGSPRAVHHCHHPYTMGKQKYLDGGPRKTGLRGGHVEPLERGEQANIFPWGENLRVVTRTYLAKMYLSRYQCIGITTSKNQTNQ